LEFEGPHTREAPGMPQWVSGSRSRSHRTRDRGRRGPARAGWRSRACLPRL